MPSYDPVYVVACTSCQHVIDTCPYCHHASLVLEEAPGRKRGIRFRGHVRVCPVCGTTFHAPRGSKRVYCSDRCANRDAKRRERERRAAQGLCIDCGAELPEGAPFGSSCESCRLKRKERRARGRAKHQAGPRSIADEVREEARTRIEEEPLGQLLDTLSREVDELRSLMRSSESAREEALASSVFGTLEELLEEIETEEEAEAVEEEI